MPKDIKDNILFVVVIILTIVVSVFLISCQIRPTATDEEILLDISSKNHPTTETETIITQSPSNGNETIRPTEPTSPIPVVCQHKSTTIIVKDATCIETGMQNIICSDCGSEMEKNIIETIPHEWEHIIIEANCEENGETYDICSVCKTKENRYIIQKLNHRTETYTQKATCTNSGETKTVCTICDKVISKQTLPQKEHEWEEINRTLATPINDGVITYKCSSCNKEEYAYEKFYQNGDVNLYIPSIGMNCEIILAECNQKSTDTYDISCDMNFINNNNPVFFGHNTRSLGTLHKVKIGDIIYFTKDGVTKIYRVTVSEEGYIVDNNTNIKGKETGELCISNKEKNTLHFFTCHRTIFNPDGRWIVFAEIVE